MICALLLQAHIISPRCFRTSIFSLHSSITITVLKAVESAKIKYPKKGEEFDARIKTIAKLHLPLSVCTTMLAYGRFYECCSISTTDFDFDAFFT